MSETQELEVVKTDNDMVMEQLIMFMLLEERLLLLDKSLEEYKDRNKNREAWREICQALFPGPEEKSASSNDLIYMQKYEKILSFFSVMNLIKLWRTHQE